MDGKFGKITRKIKKLHKILDKVDIMQYIMYSKDNILLEILKFMNILMRRIAI